MKVEQLCGRIVRGKSPEDFERLAAGTGRLLAWTTGGDALELFLGLSDAQLICTIGKKEAWLRERVSQGWEFRLVVFPEASCQLADWDGLFFLIKEHYPEVYSKFKRWQDDLRERTVVNDIYAVTGALEFDETEAKQPTSEV